MSNPGSAGTNQAHGERLNRRRFLSLGARAGLAGGAAAVLGRGALAGALDARRTRGNVYAWGNGVTTPTAVGLGDVVSIDSGSDVSFAVMANGTMWGWGDNSFGQLGQGNTNEYLTPVMVPGLSSVVKCASGLRDGFAIEESGGVYGWGKGPGTVSPVPVPSAQPVTTATDIAAAWLSEYVVSTSGQLLAWGLNSAGQLGLGYTGGAGQDTAMVVPGLPEVVAVTAGRLNAAVLTKTGSVYAWGYNAFGQLGIGSTVDTDSPAPVSIEGVVQQISYGGDVLKNGTSMACTTDGRCWVWGNGKHGQLGNGTLGNVSLPQVVPGLSDIVSVSTHGAHCMALDNQGNVWCWGDNELGEVGDGSENDAHFPVQVLTGASAIVAGANLSVAIVP